MSVVIVARRPGRIVIVVFPVQRIAFPRSHQGLIKIGKIGIV